MFELGRTFLSAVARKPQALAVIDGDRRLTYAAWCDEVLRAAAGLRQLGLTNGDHVVVVLQNRWETATLHWACQLLGVIVTPVNWRASSDELDYILQDANARAVVYEAVSAAAVADTKTSAGRPRIGVGTAEGASTTFDPLLNTPPWPLIPSHRRGILLLCCILQGRQGGAKVCPARTEQSELLHLHTWHKISTPLGSPRWRSCHSITRWACGRFWR